MLTAIYMGLAQYELDEQRPAKTDKKKGVDELMCTLDDVFDKFKKELFASLRQSDKLQRRIAHLEACIKSKGNGSHVLNTKELAVYCDIYHTKFASSES